MVFKLMPTNYCGAPCSTGFEIAKDFGDRSRKQRLTFLTQTEFLTQYLQTYPLGTIYEILMGTNKGQIMISYHLAYDSKCGTTVESPTGRGHFFTGH